MVIVLEFFLFSFNLFKHTLLADDAFVTHIS